MTEPTYLTETRAGYNAIAPGYIERFGRWLEAVPLERGMITAFAELVRDGGPVADVGSGPGQVTAFLNSLGVRAFGIDLSPVMVELARSTYPDLRFEEGSMTALDLADDALGGLLACYSIIHIAAEDLPAVFAEFRRVLAPGGLLLLGFQVGEDVMHYDEGFGHAVSLDFRRLMPDRVADLLRQAGFTIQARLVREPGESEKHPQAFLLASSPQ